MSSDPRTGRLPDLLIIGAMKAATGSLHFYLRAHPEIDMSFPKELNFFCHDENWSRGVSWYASHFNTTKRLMGESSPAYTSYPTSRHIPERIRQVVPQAKLIYLLREPIGRIESHHMTWQLEIEGRACPIADALAAAPRLADHPYVAWSKYGLQLEQYLEHFPREQILVLASDDLLTRRYETLDRVFRFLGVAAGFRHSEFDLIFNRFDDRVLLRDCKLAQAARSAGKVVDDVFKPGAPVLRQKESLPADLRARILEELAPDHELLKKLLGVSRPPWEAGVLS